MGLVEVTSHRSYINPHIKPWAPHETWEQERALEEGLSGSGTACLYPSPEAMSRVDLSHLADRPYQRQMASGRGVLDLVYFDMASLEQYRNDPRYWFELYDFGVEWGISDEAWLSEDEPERDKITSVRAGFAFDGRELESGSPSRRFVCVFMSDLWKLTPAHQQRMATWEVENQEACVPHPTWWTEQMGDWPDHIGLFDKVLGERQALSAAWEVVFGEPLFRPKERHRSWGWLLRPTSSEWDQFVLLTDQLLSESIRSEALDAAGAPTENAKGQVLGTLARLTEFMLERTSVPANQVHEAFKPMKVIRKQRQRPAHDAAGATRDQEAFVRQREMLVELAHSLEGLRRFIERHPRFAASGRVPETTLDRWLTV